MVLKTRLVVSSGVDQHVSRLCECGTVFGWCLFVLLTQQNVISTKALQQLEMHVADIKMCSWHQYAG